MAEVFPPAGLNMGTPDWGFPETPDANVNVIKLGDGYVSREPVGLNHISTSYNPVWSFLSPAVGQAAKDFLTPRLKLNTLLWNHPVTGAQLRVTVESVSLTYDEYNNAVLNVTFETDHNPG